MARNALDDLLQTHAFWLFDVAPIEPLALPVFTPLLGFSAISAPEMSLDMYDVNEANWFFTKKVVKKADISSITLSRGCRWYDSDFYRWILAALTGQTGGVDTGVNNPTVDRALQLGGATPRRDLCLVQFLPRMSGAAAVEAITGVQAPNVVGVGPFEFAPRLPAKAWMLYGCIPSRYRAGSDFDATSADVSIAELELSVEMFDEISLSSA